MLNLTKLYLYRMLRTKVAWACMIILVGLTAFVERHAMSKKGPETKKAEKSRENIKKAQFYVGFHAKPGDKLQKGA